jgi:hypothetical protein
MKITRSFVNSLVVCGVALAMVSTLAAQTVTEGGAKVIRIKGPARFTTGNNIWQPLKVGDVLKAGSIVQTSTEKGSYVDLAMGDVNAPVAVESAPKYQAMTASSTLGYQPSAEQDVVRVAENTALGIDKLTFQQTGAEVVSETQLDLKAGRVTGNVKKLSAASRYEIKLPDGVAGIRGSLYTVNSRGTLSMLYGSAVISYIDPKTHQPVTKVVVAGQTFNPTTLQVTEMPRSERRILQLLAPLLQNFVSPPRTVDVQNTVPYQVSPTK